jgi:hypothetical protein
VELTGAWCRLAGGFRGEKPGRVVDRPVPAEEVHPSWAAKQAQKEKAGIGQFAGKRVVFKDDDDD